MKENLKKTINYNNSQGYSYSIAVALFCNSNKITWRKRFYFFNLMYLINNISYIYEPN